jgi:drug/metabolite transporter (DMT)-like permease
MKVDIEFGKKISIFVAFILSIIGAVALVIIKKINSNILSKYWIVIPIIINILSGFLVLIGLKYSSITVFNLQWNLISNILVTFIGIFYLKEVYSIYEIAGLLLGFISIFILNIEDIQ